MDVKVLTITENEVFYYSDASIDETLIGGYFISNENIEDGDVSLFFYGSTLAVKQTALLMEYLFATFNHNYN